MTIGIDNEEQLEQWRRTAGSHSVASCDPLRSAVEALLPWLENAEAQCLIGKDPCVKAMADLRAALAHTSRDRLTV